MSERKEDAGNQELKPPSPEEEHAAEGVNLKHGEPVRANTDFVLLPTDDLNPGGTVDVSENDAALFRQIDEGKKRVKGNDLEPRDEHILELDESATSTGEMRSGEVDDIVGVKISIPKLLKLEIERVKGCILGLSFFSDLVAKDCLEQHGHLLAAQTQVLDAFGHLQKMQGKYPPPADEADGAVVDHGNADFMGTLMDAE